MNSLGIINLISGWVIPRVLISVLHFYFKYERLTALNCFKIHFNSLSLVSFILKHNLLIDYSERSAVIQLPLQGVWTKRSFWRVFGSCHDTSALYASWRNAEFQLIKYYTLRELPSTFGHGLITALHRSRMTIHNFYAS